MLKTGVIWLYRHTTFKYFSGINLFNALRATLMNGKKLNLIIIIIMQIVIKL